MWVKRPASHPPASTAVATNVCTLHAVPLSRTAIIKVESWHRHYYKSNTHEGLGGTSVRPGDEKEVNERPHHHRCEGRRRPQWGWPWESLLACLVVVLLPSPHGMEEPQVAVEEGGEGHEIAISRSAPFAAGRATPLPDVFVFVLGGVRCVSYVPSDRLLLRFHFRCLPLVVRAHGNPQERKKEDEGKEEEKAGR